MLIGVVGFIGSGKGTVGNLLEENGFIKDSFAKPLKDACAVIFGWPRELLEGDTKESREWRELPDTYWTEKFGYTFSPRLALQLMGTEAGREVFNQDIWIISLLNRVKGKNVVVTDVRFKNEIKYIQSNGGKIIRVKRGPDPAWYSIAERANAGEYVSELKLEKLGIHPSEWDWIGCKIDHEIENDGDLVQLGNKVNSLLQFIKI